MWTTKAEAKAAFRRLANVLGKDTKPWVTGSDGITRAIIGAWYLETGDGYVIREIVNASGGVRNPLDAPRMSGREFIRAVHFAVNAIWNMESGAPE